jgi:hypothetical protein
MFAAAMTSADGIATVRGCDGCTLCCKVMRAPTLPKPANSWCPYCKVGVGCSIYETRPTECAGFLCGYLLIPGLGPEWKPAVSHLVIVGGIDDGRINIVVDPARPDAWQRQPYYRVLKDWARRALAQHKQTVLTIGQRSIVLLADRDVDVGIVGADEVITVVQNPPGSDMTHEVYVVDGNSPAGKKIAAAQGRPVPFTGVGEGFRKGRTLA